MLMINSGGRRVMVQTQEAQACRCAAQIQPYLAQALTPAHQAEFEMHLMDCPACKASVEVGQQLSSANQVRDKYCGQLRAIPVRRKR